MPRQASRITLEITDIKIERLQDITEKDSISEGTSYFIAAGKTKNAIMSMKAAFVDMFLSIYPEEFNPFVWVVEFKKI
jgi:hypothetical protein